MCRTELKGHSRHPGLLSFITSVTLLMGIKIVFFHSFFSYSWWGPHFYFNIMFFPHRVLFDITTLIFLRKCSHISIFFTSVGWCHFWWSLIGMSEYLPFDCRYYLWLKWEIFVSKVEILGYCSGFTTNSQKITCLVS